MWLLSLLSKLKPVTRYSEKSCDVLCSGIVTKVTYSNGELPLILILVVTECYDRQLLGDV